jgi:uncharacterized protein DUF559
MSQTVSEHGNCGKTPRTLSGCFGGNSDSGQVGGLKFRRQQPLGRYIVDFICLEKRLVIQVDGGQHSEQVAYDVERDIWLRDQGFNLLRFWNHDVLKNIDGVVEVVVKTLRNTPFLDPSPQGGRKKIMRGRQCSPVRP